MYQYIISIKQRDEREREGDLPYNTHVPVYKFPLNNGKRERERERESYHTLRKT